MFKDKPGEWHELLTTGGERGLMLIPLTQEAVDRYSPQTYHVEADLRNEVGRQETLPPEPRTKEVTQGQE